MGPDGKLYFNIGAPGNIVMPGYFQASINRVDPATGELDAGLFFICFQRDPERQFVAIQRRLEILREEQDRLRLHLVAPGLLGRQDRPGSCAVGAVVEKRHRGVERPEGRPLVVVAHACLLRIRAAP